MADQLVIRGAREHNLKDISLDLPRDSLIVFTGLSGSGKSSLAFDTIFAEGQRRYVESLSAYARQFLGQMDKPDVDFIEGLSPAVSIDQKSTSKNPRSTVGTITEVYDYLRLLFARAGRPHCPQCGSPIERQTPQQIVDRVLQLDEGTRFQVLAPVIRGRKGEYVELFRSLQSQGFSRARVNGETVQLAQMIDGPPKLEKQKKHTIEVVVDRLAAKASAKRRLTDSVETALNLASGLVIFDLVDADAEGPTQGAEVLRADVVPQRARHRDRRARATLLLVQLTVRCLPRVPRPRHAHGGRPRAGRRRRAGHARRGRHPALVGRARQRLLHPLARRAGRRARLRPRHALGEAAGQGSRRDPRGPPDQGARAAHQPLRTRAVLLDQLRGRHPLHRATAPRGRERHQPRALRGLHARGPVPGLRGHPAQAGVDVGDDRWAAQGRRRRPRQVDRRGVRSADQRGRRLPLRPRPLDPRASDRRAGAQGDPGAAALPARRRARLPLARPSLRPPCPVARPSASGWPPRSAPAWWACSTCSTSRASVCTSATTSA